LRVPVCHIQNERNNKKHDQLSDYAPKIRSDYYRNYKTGELNKKSHAKNNIDKLMLYRQLIPEKIRE
jgi:hypothetical protein